MSNIPLSLYIHLPWCIRKCPYCDFNSHAVQNEIPEDQYIDRLIEDFKEQLPKIKSREIKTIFFGGGTPSLFSAKSLDRLLTSLFSLTTFSKNCEITLEANPGTVEQQRFKGYFEAGINRISLGVQSFNDEKLKALGRIHSSDEAKNAIESIKQAGFTNFNIDIMHGLPNQTLAEAMFDLTIALQFNPTHLSWYQLTIEPNTVFYKQKPTLPDEKVLADIEEQGLQLLNENNLNRYEVSAYCRATHQSQHNLNYWLFGDYLGIGAGAHSKLTNDKMEITRHWQVRQPKDYLTKNMTVKHHRLNQEEKVFEFMLNALRLHQTIPLQIFEERTGLSQQLLQPTIQKAQIAGLLSDSKAIETTPLGKRFLNDLVNLFSS